MKEKCDEKAEPSQECLKLSAMAHLRLLFFFISIVTLLINLDYIRIF